MQEEELNKKLAKWAGFKLQTVWPEYCDLGKVLKWTYPDGKYHRDPPNFPESLDACCQWLWKKAIKILAGTEREGCEKLLGLWLEENLEHPLTALALCLAISKLIEKDIDSVNMVGAPGR